VIHQRNAEERESLLAQYERSGQTQRRFCQENRLPLSTLTYWLRQRRQRRPVKGSFVQLPVAAACLPGTGEPAAGTVQIRLPSQIEVRVGAGADPMWVGALLQGVLACSG